MSESTTEQSSREQEAYEMVDRFLRNNLSDMDYADYSQALNLLSGSAESGEAKTLRTCIAALEAAESEMRDWHIEHPARVQISNAIDDAQAALSTPSALPAQAMEAELSDEQIAKALAAWFNDDGNGTFEARMRRAIIALAAPQKGEA